MIFSTKFFQFYSNCVTHRGEMNENLNRLSDRINHLENVVTNLTESLPELARQLGSEIRRQYPRPNGGHIS